MARSVSRLSPASHHRFRHLTALWAGTGVLRRPWAAGQVSSLQADRWGGHMSDTVRYLIRHAAVGVALLMAAGCDGGGESFTPPPNADVSGNWILNWTNMRGTVSGIGTLTCSAIGLHATITQTGTSLTGRSSALGHSPALLGGSRSPKRRPAVQSAAGPSPATISISTWPPRTPTKMAPCRVTACPARQRGARIWAHLLVW